MLPADVPRICKITGKASVVESPFSKKNKRNVCIVYQVHWYVPKSCSSRNFGKFSINPATGLESTGCQATKNTLLTKFLKGVLKISVNFHEELYNGVPF